MDLRSAPHICLLALSLSLVNTEVTAKEAFDRASIWGGVDIGRGNFKTSGDVDKDETALYLGFKVGYRFNLPEPGIPPYSVRRGDFAANLPFS